jgi:tetratricopeptide (TPR) repeat protein
MAKNIYRWNITTLLLAFVVISCDSYLDIKPKGVQVLETVNDYDQWLNSYKVATDLPNELNLLADNIDNSDVSNPPTSQDDRIYTWQSQYLEDLRSAPVMWEDHYKSIYYFNTVLEEIDGATGEELQKESLKAEALLGRALEYLYLVNLYGKAYNENTASQDLAVPFVTSNNLSTPTPERSTVQEIYNKIIEDINTAIPNLPHDNSKNRFRGSVASAYSVLARTYLFMGDYSKAAQNAQLALDNGTNEVLDYSVMTSVIDIPNLMIRSDAIYARCSRIHEYVVSPTLNFLKTFDTTDLRLHFYYSELGDYSFAVREQAQYLSYGVEYENNFPNWGTSVAEMYLILAEAAARSNNLSLACDQLHQVRKCRFPADTYEKYQSNNQEEVLQKVLTERTFEFPYCGMRWFDMRRLDTEGRMSTVNRYDGQENLIATLPTGSNKYTLQIPLQVLFFNPDWPQNPD